MTRPKQDEELKAITTIVTALESVPEGRREAVLDYISSRFLVAPMVQVRAEEMCASVPTDLGAEPEPQ